MHYQWDFSVVFRHFDFLLQGAAGTLELAGTALAIALPLGLLLAIVRILRIPVLSMLAVVYIDLFRASASLILIFWFFFAFPILIRVDFGSFTAASLALGLQAAAYLAEVYRSGILSIGRGQWDAARALGMGYVPAMRYVILPQAIRRVVPVIFTRIVDLLKTTSLAAAISYDELVHHAQRLSSDTFRPIETFTVVALMFFVTIFTLSQLTRWLERHLARSD
jgi:polar amino acid transport system permease protein